MTTGAVDNYLSDDEKEYFEGRGTDEEKFDDSYVEDGEATEVEPEENGAATSGNESEATDKIQEEDEHTEPLELDDAEEAEDDSESKRDYKKAYKTAIHKRKEMKEQLEAQAKKASELEENLAKLQQLVSQTQQQSQIQKPQEPPEEIPDPETDPLAYQQYKINKLEQNIVNQQKYLKQQYEQSQRAQQEQAFMQTYKAQAQQFAQKTPDFTDAYNHLVVEKLAEYQEAGYSREQAERLLIEDEMAIVAKAFNDKVNPAERIYNTAKRRGYSAKAKAPPKKNLDNIKRGIENSKSLKSGGGEREDAELGIDDVDNMSFGEFENFFDKFKAKAKGRL